MERLVATQPMQPDRAQWSFSIDVVVPLLQMCGGTELGYADPLLGGPALRVVAALCKVAHRDASVVNLTDSGILQGFHLDLHNMGSGSSGEMERLAMIDAISS